MFSTTTSSEKIIASPHKEAANMKMLKGSWMGTILKGFEGKLRRKWIGQGHRVYASVRIS